MATAKVITDGSTQMIMLPEGYRFDCDEVEVEQNGARIMLAPKKAGHLTKEAIEALCSLGEEVADAIIEARKNDFLPKREEL